MARDNQEPSTVQLICSYTNVVVALNDSLKTPSNVQAGETITKTLQGVCTLIDALVSKQHRDIPDTVRCSG